MLCHPIKHTNASLFFSVSDLQFFLVLILLLLLSKYICKPIFIQTKTTAKHTKLNYIFSIIFCCLFVQRIAYTHMCSRMILLLVYLFCSFQFDEKSNKNYLNYFLLLVVLANRKETKFFYFKCVYFFSLCIFFAGRLKTYRRVLLIEICCIMNAMRA